MHKNDILMIRMEIIGSNTEKNNKEYVDFIVCKRITSVNIINGNTMQLCVKYVQIHVCFQVLVQFFKAYSSDKNHSSSDII
jgi:hypothetical protein